MRIRTIKPEFFTHEELSDLELTSKLPIRLSFIGLWCAADREGRFKWKPRSLGIQILPYDDINFSVILDALMSKGFVKRYSVDGVTYGFIPSFPRHQVINNREQASSIPPFDQELTRESGVDDACRDALKSRESGVGHACKGEGKGKEWKGREGKEDKLELELPFESDAFELAWSMWQEHRKEKKKKLTQSTASMQLKEMKEIGESRAISMINYSIKNGWTGLFEDKTSFVTPIVRKPQTSDQFSI
jgi:hypothetical protein